jgi:hypothetical protein
MLRASVKEGSAAKLAEAVSHRHTVHSFDHVAVNDDVDACDRIGGRDEIAGTIATKYQQAHNRTSSISTLHYSSNRRRVHFDGIGGRGMDAADRSKGVRR